MSNSKGVGMTRRDFARAAAATAAGALFAVTAPASAAPQMEDPDTALSEVRRAAAALTSDADLEELQVQVKGVLDLAKKLRGAYVADGAEPAFVFRAMVTGGRHAR